jgi:hypothetical protein
MSPPAILQYPDSDPADKSARSADRPAGRNGASWRERVPGRALTEAEIATLKPISPKTVWIAGIKYADSQTGKIISGRNGAGDHSGMIFPNVFPGDDHAREYLLRLSHPELRYDKNGEAKETGKYRYAPGRGNILYLVPETDPALLEDCTVPVLLVEGAKKALAAWQEIGLDELTGQPRFLVVAVGGAWNWRGTIARAPGPDGSRRPVKGIIPDFHRIALKGREFVLAYDSDVNTNSMVLAARNGLVRELTERGAKVGCLEWQPEQGKGFDDYLLTVGGNQVLADLAQVQFGDWRDLLLRNDSRKLTRTFRNVLLHFKNLPEWEGVVGYNDFTGAPVVLAPPPAPIITPVGAELDDNFDIGTLVWLEQHGLPVSPAVVRSAMDFFAREHPFHPVRDFLNSLKWDGTERLNTWLITFANGTAQDITRDPNRNPVYYSPYLAAVGRMFLISAVARIYRPGCQVDHTLVLQGGQGTYKSSMLRALAVRESWFSDQIRDFGREAEQLLRGTWIVELAELAVLTSKHTEMERAKGFLTQRDGHLRLPYGHRPGRFARSCVFAGTTNEQEFLKDATGNRRFWLVRCGPINLEGLRAVVDQLLAEAVVRFQQGESWWITDAKVLETAEEEQRERAVRDPWHERVMTLARLDLAAHGSTSSAAILAGLGVPLERQDQAHKNRVGRILTFEGWERFHTGPRAAREYKWRPGKSGGPVDQL